MEYKEIPYPRERDKVVMDIIVAAGLTRAEICSLNRCKGFLGVIFLSDMATADGKYLEQFVLDPQENITKSKYEFPREEPTKTDWTRGTKFWLNYTATGKRLQADLGKWIHPTHRTWRWYYNKETDDLQRIEKKILYHY